jgi:hypothetical protein
MDENEILGYFNNLLILLRLTALRITMKKTYKIIFDVSLK